MTVTMTMTRVSDVGILRKVRKLAHSKVPIATMIITPVNAAIGNFSIKPEPIMINTRSSKEAVIPDKRARAPDEILMRLCPIIAQPPIPEKNPDRIFAVPCATASLFPRPRVWVISSTIFNVSRLSMSPTPATISA